MRIIISPAKKMNICDDILEISGTPCYLKDTEVLMKYLQTLSYEEVKNIWCCNDKIASLNFRRFQEMDLTKRLTPAILSYEGLQYQYMKPEIFTDSELEYLQEHLCILSGFYGVLKPFDGVIPYRLEMQAKIKLTGKEYEYCNLYDFWGNKIYQKIIKEMSKEKIILNLASKEYSKAIEHYLSPEIRFVNCIFGRQVVDKNGNLQIKVKGTEAKMVRGEMVRYLAVEKVKTLVGVKRFQGLGFRYQRELSDENQLVFLK